MWFREYKDYPEDSQVLQEQVEPGSGIVGCEMHELQGWGEVYDQPKQGKPGFFRLFFRTILVPFQSTS